MERKNSHVCAESKMAQDESFEVRKQHLLTRYFGLSSTEELKNDLMNYQHTSTSLTIDCTAIVNCQFRFVAAYIDVLVIIKLTNGYSWDDSSHSYEILAFFRSRPCHNLKGTNILSVRVERRNMTINMRK